MRYIELQYKPCGHRVRYAIGMFGPSPGMGLCCICERLRTEGKTESTK